MVALGFLVYATMLAVPMALCARLGWSFARLVRGFIVSGASASLGATPGLLLTTSGFRHSPVWMLFGAGLGAVLGLALVERAAGHGFGPPRALVLAALAFAASATLVMVASALLQPGGFVSFSMAIAVVSPTAFGYAAGKPPPIRP